MPIYIDTKANHLADDLSRENLDFFLSKGLDTNHYLTLVPWTLLDPLLDSEADWVLLIGGISSAVLSEWFSPSDTHGGDERIPFFLLNIPNKLPIPTIRTATLHAVT